MTEKNLPQTLPSVETEQQTASAEMYQIVLLDDDDHTAEYVVEMMATLFQIGRERAEYIVLEVDGTGRSVVKICTLHEALEGRDAILAYGPDHRLPHSFSSMRARVEPVID